MGTKPGSSLLRIVHRLTISSRVRASSSSSLASTWEARAEWNEEIRRLFEAQLIHAIATARKS